MATAPATPGGPAAAAACRSCVLAGFLLVFAVTGCQTQQPAPLSVIPQTVPAPARSEGSEVRLKLVTFNIWGLPRWMTGAPHGRYGRIARELERMDADIVFLQEAWIASARASAPASGAWSIARAAGQGTFFQQNGLLTLSKYPVVGGQFYPYSHASLPDALVSKGLLKVTVRLPGGERLNLWNTHLQDGGALSIRRSQVRELIARIQAAEDGQVADVIGGDFNCTPDSPVYGELEAALGPDVQQRSGRVPFATWDGLSREPGAGRTYDHVFVVSRAPGRQVFVDQQIAFTAERREDRLSDHLGIEAVVSLTPARLSVSASPVSVAWPPAAGAMPVLAGKQ